MNLYIFFSHRPIFKLLSNFFPFSILFLHHLKWWSWECLYITLRVTENYSVILHHFYSVNHQICNLQFNRSLLKNASADGVVSVRSHDAIVQVNPPVSDYWDVKLYLVEVCFLEIYKNCHMVWYSKYESESQDWRCGSLWQGERPRLFMLQGEYTGVGGVRYV